MCRRSALLGRQALRILAIGAETRYVHSGEVLFSAGDEADGGFVVQEGRFTSARVRRRAGSSRSGRARCSASSRCSPRPTRPATATALEPSTVLRIPRPLFLKMLDSFPDAARKLREILASRLDQSARDIHNVRNALDAHEPRRSHPRVPMSVTNRR